jgi:hypothetical protein
MINLNNGHTSTLVIVEYYERLPSMLNLSSVKLFKVIKILLTWFQQYGLLCYKRINGMQDIMVPMENGLLILVRVLSLQKTLVVKLYTLPSRMLYQILSQLIGHLLMILLFLTKIQRVL